MPITVQDLIKHAMLGGGSGGGGADGEKSLLDAMIDGTEHEVSSDTVEYVGPYALAQKPGMKAVNLPKVQSTAPYAFYLNNALETVNMPKLEQVAGYSFESCKALATVNMPSAKKIETYAFRRCNSLTRVVFPAVEEYVMSYAFAECKALTTADFPVLTMVYNSAFDSCYVLTALILRAGTVATLYNANAFNKCYHILGTVNTTYNPDGLKDGYIYVPAALVDTYKAATNWSTYADQFRALEDYTVDGTITGELDESKI